MLHTVAIVIHASTGALAFAVGLLALQRARWFRTYLVFLWAMALSLVVAVVDEWGALGMATRVIFTGLIVLAAAMLVRAELARRNRPDQSGGPSARYVEHLGFTLVSLFDAFVVVSVLNAGAPGAVVALAGVLVGVAGHFAIGAARRALVQTGSALPSAQAAAQAPVATGSPAARP